MKNRIYLFKFSMRNPMAWLILLATGCQYSHAAIESGGVLYDASETRGAFARADREAFVGRECLVCEFEGDLSDWLRAMDGRRYDYRGVVGWLLCRYWRRGCGSGQRFYCFEAASAALKAVGRTSVDQLAISGCDLLRVMPGGLRYQVFGGV